MLHPEIIKDHSKDCNALAEVRKGTLKDPWSRFPSFENGTLLFNCTGCSAKMQVDIGEVATYSDTYVNGIFE